MKLSITKEELTKALGIVSRGMSSRSTLPILSGILIEAAGRNVTFQTTDLEVSIRSTAIAFVERSGRTVVPGKLFLEIIKSLPDAAIQLTLENERFKIECMNSSFTLNTLNPLDFPQFPELSISKEACVGVPVLAGMVKQVSRAVSRDESRAVLCGIYLVIKEGILTLVATDSYRLAISEKKLETNDVQDMNVILPGRTLDEVMKCAAAEQEIKIGLTDNQVMMTFGDTVFVTRRIEGEFPNYRRLLPNDHTLQARVETDVLISTVKRVSLMAQSNSPIIFLFSGATQSIEVSSQSQDVGTAVETIPAEVDGDELKIAFNHSYILDGLNSIGSKETIIETLAAHKPGILRSSKGETDFLYLAMPVRLG